MLKTLKFYNSNSIIHEMNAFLKLIMAILFVLAVFISNSIISKLILLVFLIIVVLSTNVPFKYYLKTIFSMNYLYLIVGIINLLIFRSWSHLLLGFFSLTMIIIMLSTILLTTRSKTLTRALEIIFYPLKLIGINNCKLAYRLMFLLRFSSIYEEEWNKVRKSLKNRTDNLTFFENLKNYKNCIEPTFTKSMEEYDRREDVMILRNYDFDDSKKLTLLTNKIDFLLIATQIFMFIAIIIKG